MVVGCLVKNASVGCCVSEGNGGLGGKAKREELRGFYPCQKLGSPGSWGCSIKDHASRLHYSKE